MLMLADEGGGGVENRQNSADIVYGSPLTYFVTKGAKNLQNPVNVVY